MIEKNPEAFKPIHQQEYFGVWSHLLTISGFIFTVQPVHTVSNDQNLGFFPTVTVKWTVRSTEGDALNFIRVLSALLCSRKRLRKMGRTKEH